MPLTPLAPSVLVNALPLASRLTGVGYYTLELFSALAHHRRAAQSAQNSRLHLFLGGQTCTHWSGGAGGESGSGGAELAGAVGVADSARSLGFLAVKTWLKKQLAPSQWLRARVRAGQTRQFQAALKTLPLEASSGQSPTIYHEPNFIAFPYEGPTVVTVHDLSFIRHPQTHPAERVRFMTEHIQASLQQASRIVVVSEFVGNEMHELFGKGMAEKTVVVRNGVSARFLGGLGKQDPLPRVDAPPVVPSAIDHILARHGLRHRGYLLSVGALEPRKNLISLLDAYASLPPSLKAQFPLVLVGPKGWHLKAFEAKLAALRHEPIYWLGYVNDTSLRALYASAKAFAYLSVYEGFGLPVLESMACGTPVVVSQAKALTELVGSAGLVADTYDVPAIAQALERRLLDEPLWAQHRAHGLALAQELSWSKAALAMEAVYAELAHAA